MSAARVLVGGAGVLALVLLAGVDMLQGSGGLSVHDVLAALLEPQSSAAHGVVRDIRAPRAAAGAIAGGALAAATVLLQALTANRLGEPGTLGLTAGGALAVAAVAVLAPVDAGLSTIFVAATGVVLGGAIVAGLALAAGSGALRLVLAGMAVSLALAALTAAIQLLDTTRTADLFFWGAGSLLQLGWSTVRAAAVVAAVGLLAAAAVARPLDVAVLGRDTARALGQRTGLVNAAAGAAAVLLTAAAVGVAGPIGFAGLAAVTVARRSGVTGHRALLAIAVPWGGALVLLADVLARLVLGADRELPAGVVCAILGAPVLVLVASRLAADTATPLADRSSAPRRRTLLALAVAPLLAAVAIAGLCLGELRVGPVEMARAIVGAGDPLAELALDLRLPRLGVAILAGGCLAAAGTLFQGVVRNPLASPEIVGVTGGASVGAVAVLLAAPAAAAWVLPLAAIAGAIAALAAVLAIAGRRSASPARLALIGLGISAMCAGVTTLLVLQAQAAATTTVTFLAGSTYAADWSDLRLIAIPAAVLLPLALLATRALDLLALGDDSAGSLGLPVAAARALLLLLGAGLAGIAVAAAGAIAFVGLLAPHAARLLVGARHRLLTPVAVGLGMSLLGAGDVIGRVAFAPTEIPSGIVVTLIGAPYFAWLLLRSRAAAG